MSTVIKPLDANSSKQISQCYRNSHKYLSCVLPHDIEFSSFDLRSTDTDIDSDTYSDMDTGHGICEKINTMIWQGHRRNIKYK